MADIRHHKYESLLVDAGVEDFAVDKNAGQAVIHWMDHSVLKTSL